METLKKIGIVLVLLDFTALTAWALFTGSSPELFAQIWDNPWAVQISVDLCIAAMFGIAWVWRDAKERGINPLPWALAVLPLGSLALLAYAMRRSFAEAPSPRRVASLEARLR